MKRSKFSTARIHNIAYIILTKEQSPMMYYSVYISNLMNIYLIKCATSLGVYTVHDIKMTMQAWQ